MENVEEKLQWAARLAASGDFAEIVTLGRQILVTAVDAAPLLEIGVLLSNYGFLSEAQACYETKGHPLCCCPARVSPAADAHIISVISNKRTPTLFYIKFHLCNTVSHHDQAPLIAHFAV